MHVTIENLTNRPILLRCNSGETLHVAPRTISAEIPDVEVRNNPKVQKLLDLHVITLHEAGKGKHPAAVSARTIEGKTMSTKSKK